MSGVARLRVTHSIAETRAVLGDLRGAKTIGFVPTMGALHAGHARLIETAREQSGFVVVSIFVNAPQFNQREDFERYARTLPADLALCSEAGADLVFAPSNEEMYPERLETSVDVEGVSAHFCGASRPGHFRAVATVVTKLFGIVGPELAFFGEKDAQQLAVIMRMVRDLNVPVRIVPVATVREADGLAMSSRNGRLSAAERAVAVCLIEALRDAEEQIRAGARGAREVLERSGRVLKRPGVEVDYFDVADPVTMHPVEEIRGPVRVMGAIFVGSTRLIDNLMCLPEKSGRLI